MADGEEVGRTSINVDKALTHAGYSASIKLSDTDKYELVVIDAIYNGNAADIDVSKKFVYQSMVEDSE